MTTDADFGTTAHLARFFATREANEDMNALEAWTYGDGAIAVAIGLGVIVASAASAAAISLFFALGVATK